MWKTITLLTLGLTFLSLTGCNQSLFDDETPRSQYERYSLLRGEYRPMRESNRAGLDRPNLRERLAPLEEVD